MLKAKKPGLGASEYIAGATRQLNDLITQMNDKSDDETMNTVSPIGAAKLNKALTEMLIGADQVAIATYEKMAAKGELGKLPSQALPMTARDLCSLKGK